MKKILYILFRIINYFLTKLPDWIKFLVSDFFYIILHYIVGYRKKVVKNNLKNAFPDKSKRELQIIKKKYYHHLCDTIIETITLHSVSSKKMNKICTYENLDLLEKLYNQGKDIIAVVGHYGNWEYLTGLKLSTNYEVLALYKPLHNKYFDKFAYSIRNQFGMLPVPIKATMKTLLQYKRDNIRTLMIIVGDQAPAKNEIQYWTNFLNQETALYLGIEKIAKRLNSAVVFINMDKVKRGYYNIKFTELFIDSEKTNAYEISESHLRTLEKKIIEKPYYWLWSHRRWKHSKKDFTTIDNKAYKND